ncbi:MAG: DNA primase [Candidatus Micrarchaeota archaeon]|nr:DNA primase [Candidatus Micrarchaeota archaeon]
MSKLAQSNSKYTIIAKFEANGVVEKPDVIGAIFGQTEGLLGPDMDLRELQRTGRIGRIEVTLKTTNGKVSGKITIPSSLDASETALIAACCETIERVGPCNAKVVVEKIEDVRAEKRRYVIERAKELLSKMFDYGLEKDITEQIKEAVRASEVTSYQGLSCGPNIESYDSIIIVEGRADVINLLRAGIKNVIAIEGTSIPQAIIDLSKQKITTAFLDGDRGGDLILKELLEVCDIDFVARAPRGKEVEELTKKEIYKALRDQVPVDQYTEKHTEKPRKQQTQRKKPVSREIKEKIGSVLTDLTGTRAACFLGQDFEILGKVPVKEMFSALGEVEAKYLVFDGEIDQKIVNLAFQKGIECVAGMKIRGKIKVPEGLTVLTVSDIN